jgi:hypothetical protein
MQRASFIIPYEQPGFATEYRPPEKKLRGTAQTFVKIKSPVPLFSLFCENNFVRILFSHENFHKWEVKVRRHCISFALFALNERVHRNDARVSR